MKKKNATPLWELRIKWGPFEGPLIVVVLVVIGVFVGAVGTYLLILRPEIIDPLIEIRVEKTMAAQTTVRLMPTYTLYPTYTPYPTNAPTNTPMQPTVAPVNTSTPPPVTIDTMDSTSGWSTFSDPKSSIEIRSIPGVKDNAVEIAYTLEEGGWVLISKQINPEMLSGTVGIRFYRSGSGVSTTIELKLLYAPSPGGESVTYEYLWPTDTVGDWEQHEFFYSEHCEFACLDLEKVRTINFAISSREGGIPGSGTVAIDHVEGIR